MGFSVTKAGRIAALVLAATLVWGCSGDNGAPGASGNPGPSGPPGPPGPPGTPPDAPIVIGDGSELTADEIERLGKLYATITSVSVASQPEVEFTVFDEQGYPAEGIDASVVMFTFAKLMPPDPDVNGGLATWQSYINRTATSDRPGGIATAIQATNDRGGQLEYLGDDAEPQPGKYRYTFSNDVTNITTPIAVAWEPNLTHRVGLEIRLEGPGETPLAPLNPVKDFVPDNGPGTGMTKIIADTKNCADCHVEFTMHGGPRKSVDYCVTCHNPGSVDPDTGESVDMAYLAHSIHRGENRLDADENDKPYIIIGRNGTVHDYGDVTYPQALTYCETCHTASETYPDGDAWNEGATAKTCGGCHADGLIAENFDEVTGQAQYAFNHAVAEVDIGIIDDDGSCAGCHLGAIESAGPPLAVHRLVPRDDRARAEAGDNFVFEILSAENTGPGQVPLVTFRISNPQDVAYDIFTDDEFTNSAASLNLYVQWSTDDYYGGDENGLVLGAQQRDDLSIDDVQSGTLTDVGYPYRMRIGAIRDAIENGDGTANPDGSYTVPFFRALPADFTGDVAVGLAGHPAWEYVYIDGATAFDRAHAVSDVFYPGKPREAAFDSAQCNACHQRLTFHGGNRAGNYEICLLCHNADTAVCANPADDGSCPAGASQEGFHFGRMIHSIHTESASYDGGRFAGVSFPQPAANCDTCHKPGAYNVARPTARAVSTNQGADLSVWTDDIATTPTVAACSVCHNSSAALGHYDTQGAQRDTLKCNIVGAACGAADGSSGSGLPNGQESCAVCHGTGREFETSQYHNPGVEE